MQQFCNKHKKKTRSQCVTMQQRQLLYKREKEIKINIKISFLYGASSIVDLLTLIVYDYFDMIRKFLC